MKLKYITTMDKHGARSEPMLHFWNGDFWEAIEETKCKDHEYDDLIYYQYETDYYSDKLKRKE